MMIQYTISPGGETVDTTDLKSVTARCMGSIPVWGMEKK